MAHNKNFVNIDILFKAQTRKRHSRKKPKTNTQTFIVRLSEHSKR